MRTSTTARVLVASTLACVGGCDEVQGGFADDGIVALRCPTSGCSSALANTSMIGGHPLSNLSETRLEPAANDTADVRIEGGTISNWDVEADGELKLELGASGWIGGTAVKGATFVVAIDPLNGEPTISAALKIADAWCSPGAYDPTMTICRYEFVTDVVPHDPQKYPQSEELTGYYHTCPNEDEGGALGDDSKFSSAADVHVRGPRRDGSPAIRVSAGVLPPAFSTLCVARLTRSTRRRHYRSAEGRRGDPEKTEAQRPPSEIDHHAEDHHRPRDPRQRARRPARRLRAVRPPPRPPPRRPPCRRRRPSCARAGEPAPPSISPTPGQDARPRVWPFLRVLAAGDRAPETRVARRTMCIVSQPAANGRSVAATPRLIAGRAAQRPPARERETAAKHGARAGEPVVRDPGARTSRVLALFRGLAGESRVGQCAMRIAESLFCEGVIDRRQGGSTWAPWDDDPG